MTGFIEYSEARKVAEAVYEDTTGIVIPNGFVLDEQFNALGTPGVFSHTSGLYVYA
jgi:hypothetical protein